LNQKLSPLASYFLCRRKESNQRKRLFLDKGALANHASKGFSDSPSWLGRKTPPIHGRRPTGLRKRTRSAYLQEAVETWRPQRALLVTQPRATTNHADPEGGAQDVRRFPTEPWMASRKIALRSDLASSLLSGKAAFFWLLFFAARKEK
jgi:hypothetical protein